MDDKDFRKHLAALVHGHHHPEQHDWGPDSAPRKASAKPKSAKKPARRRAK